MTPTGNCAFNRELVFVLQHTSHHAIKTRLTMWKTFFETGIDNSPKGATDAEYGMDSLVALAHESGMTALQDLADVVVLMGVN